MRQLFAASLAAHVTSVRPYTNARGEEIDTLGEQLKLVTATLSVYVTEVYVLTRAELAFAFVLTTILEQEREGGALSMTTRESAQEAVLPEGSVATHDTFVSPKGKV